MEQIRIPLIVFITLFLLLQKLVSSVFLHTNAFFQTAIDLYGWIALSEEFTTSYLFYKSVLSDS